MLIKDHDSLSLGDSACQLIPGIETRDRSQIGQSRIGKLSAVLRFVSQANILPQLPRLLREGSGPVLRLMIQASNTAQIAHLLNTGTPVSFVSSFPRSGNTWLRYLLSDFFYQCHGVDTTTKLPIHKVIPDFYSNWIARRDVSVATPGVLVKTHDAFTKLSERYCQGTAWKGTGSGPFRRCKHVYIYRSPEDSLVSYYHYSHRQNCLKATTAAGIDAFCQLQLPAWEDNLTSYLSAAEQGVPVLFIPYELLLKSPEATLSNILRWLGAEDDRTKVARAVFNMQFQKMQAVNGKKSMRRGCAGSGRVELQPSTLSDIHERTARLVELANRRVIAPESRW